MSDREAFTDLGDIPPERVRPARGKMLVKREPLPEKVGKIVLPSKDANDRRFDASCASVVALGDPMRTDSGDMIPWSVKPGDKLIISKFAGFDVTIQGESEYNLMEEADALAVVDGEGSIGI